MKLKKNIPQSLQRLIHERIYRQTFKGYISKEQIVAILRMHHNISKEECPLIIKELEIMNLIEDDGNYYKVNPPKKSREELILELRKELGLI